MFLLYVYTFTICSCHVVLKVYLLTYLLTTKTCKSAGKIDCQGMQMYSVFGRQNPRSTHEGFCPGSPGAPFKDPAIPLPKISGSSATVVYELTP